MKWAARRRAFAACLLAACSCRDPNTLTQTIVTIDAAAELRARTAQLALPIRS